MRFAILAAAFLLACPPAWAGDLTVAVRDGTGRPAVDAVVMVYPAAGGSSDIKFPWPYSVAQQDLQFDPYVLIVPVGAEVEFPNRDKVRHHVYSFSSGNKFELKLYGRQEKRLVKMKTAGVVAVGCNIHDQMSAFIRVVDTAYAIKTDPSGNATLRGLPAGAATVKVWHPDIRKTEGSAQAVVPVQGVARATVSLDLRPSTRPAAHMAGMQH